MFPKQVIAIYYNIVIGTFQWKTGLFTNNIDVSKKTKTFTE